jgi:hypothetical protein
MLNIVLPNDLAVLLLRINSRKMKNTAQKLVHSILCNRKKNRSKSNVHQLVSKYTKCSIAMEWNIIVFHMLFCYNMDELPKYYETLYESILTV